MSLSIVLRGLEHPLRGMRDAGRIIQDEVEDAALTEIADIQTDLSDYPPERPGQRYERTGDLGRGWTTPEPKFVVRGESIGVGITNSTPYADWVQGERQAWMHRGRWPTVQEVLADHQASLNTAMTTAMERAAERMARGK